MSVLLPVFTVVAAVRHLGQESAVGGSGGRCGVAGRLRVNAGRRYATAGGEVTQRRIGAHGVRVQQADEEQAQHQRPQRRRW
ncbi:hypothetical protein ACIQNI_26980 [Streptomyces sp. NPDC091266]|uniref:hypothetical protein n=1 Tax=Streptomyces sp. NPDC091266 TaxID=3365978 RepID=UPI0038211B4B